MKRGLRAGDKEQGKVKEGITAVRNEERKEKNEKKDMSKGERFLRLDI